MSNDNKVPIEFTARTNDFNAGINKIKTSLGTLSKDAADISASFTKMTVALTAAAGALTVLAVKQYDAIDSLGKMARSIGSSIEEFQAFSLVAKEAGVDVGSLSALMIKAQKSIVDAASGSEQAQIALKRINLTARELIDLSPDQQFRKMAEGLSKIENPTVRNATALQLFGKNGIEVVKFLEDFNKNVENAARFQEKFNIKLSDIDVAKVEEANDAFGRVGQAILGLGNTIAIKTAPYVTYFSEALLNAGVDGETFAKMIDGAFKFVGKSIDVVANSFKGWQVIFETLKLGFLVMADSITDTLVSLDKTITETLNKIPLVTLKVRESLVQTAAGTEKAVQDQIKNIEDLKAAIGASGGDSVSQFMSGLEAGANRRAKAKGKGPVLKPGSDLISDTAGDKAAADERKALALQELATKKQIYDIGLADKKSALDAELALGRITEQQKIEMLMQYEQEAYLVQQKQIEAELQIANLTKLERQKLYDELLILKQQHDVQMNELSRQSAVEQSKIYQKLGDTIKGAFKGMVTGVLQGTQTISQAFANMGLNIITSLMSMFAEMAMQWLINQIVGTSTAASLALSNIGANAATAGSAAFASTAAIPIVGPGLAPAAASAAYAGAASFAALVPSFDVGAYNLPSDTFAMVHQGEMILDRGSAQTYREGLEANGGGGFGGMNVTIHATDAKSVQRLFKNNGSAITAAAKAQARNYNKSTRGQ